MGFQASVLAALQPITVSSCNGSFDTFPRKGKPKRTSSGASTGSASSVGGNISHSEASSPTVPKRKNDNHHHKHKTEMCRSWEELGTCVYGNQCQFAHSEDELRTVRRHPLWRTELCKTFWKDGVCPYGRCERNLLRIEIALS
ncbi:hypothetical protein DFJ73DRAFT_620965 [Zopfochytrium polystomum]|nr:hypothetical protein DFJ73DRAFT_620965 [Zopfochytrium polystomum]